ncbi:rhamnogalacturonan acetylesterase [Biscogniauxia mediterranea]|nr:rhamnogalacturonan acetylesterase [Biscogniauxia mediterranea]
MHFITFLSALASFIGLVVAKPKLLICSDSTTANYNVNDTLQGWGYYIGEYLSIHVKNHARNGRSTRSFINEGLWDRLLNVTDVGDFVVIEMGHNDDGDPETDTKDRATLPGVGEDTVIVTTASGDEETVHTFGWYLREMIADVQAIGAHPIISGMVNRNNWDNGKLQSKWAFTDYAEQVAKEEGVEWVDHTAYSVAEFQSFGQTKAKTYYPEDNTHTNPAGARINAETFVQAVKYACGGSCLATYLNEKGVALFDPPAQAC